MKKIFKYTLDVTTMQSVLIPRGALFLCATMVRGEIVLYAVVDLQAKIKDVVNIYVFGTGQELPPDVDNYQFLGTVLIPNGEVGHVFRKL